MRSEATVDAAAIAHMPRMRDAEAPAAGNRARWGRIFTHSSLIPLVLLAITLAITQSSGIDDAYISYRYADNLVAGHGLVFNVGQHVEGISNLLWTLLLAGLNGLGVSLPLAGSLLGIVALIVVVVLTRLVAITYGVSPLAAMTTAAAVAITTDLVASATMGLEGGLVAVCVLCVLFLWFRRDTAAEVGMVVAITALGAARPECLVLGAVLVVVRLLVPGVRMSRRLLVAVASIAGLLAIEVFRVVYYGELLPMSVTAKRDIGVSPLTYLPEHVRAGLTYLGHAIALPLLVVVALGVALLVLERRSGASSTRRGSSSRRCLPLLVVAGFGLVLPLVTGGDWMPNSRLIAPYIPVLYLLVAVALSSINSAIALRAAIVVPLAMALVSPHGLPLQGGSGDAAWDGIGRSLEQTKLASRPVATTVLGRVGYWAPDVRFTDMSGLTEPAVARTPGKGGVYGKLNLRYTLSRNPAIVAVNFEPHAARFLALAARADRPYVAIVSERLTAQRIFLLADPAVAPRFLTQLRERYPGAHLEASQEAVRRWRNAT
jgi:arabinofuranosyltransferase